jgi:hypothetical protein
VRRRESTLRLIASVLLIASTALPLFLGGSCARKGDGAGAKLNENIFGLYLGETKGNVFKRAHGVAEISMAPEPPRGEIRRGELFNLSAPLEPDPGIDHIRLSFFKNRLWEIVVYYKDTSANQLLWLKMKLEGQYQTQAKSPDGTTEMAFKTYWLSAPGMSITLRRIGRSTNHASNAAAMFIPAATMNTACQLPVAVVRTLDSGTSSDAVPFAVYSVPAFAAANLLPNVSAFVDGNRL